MPALPLVLQLMAAVAALIWAVILSIGLQRQVISASRLLSFNVWTAALVGCALTLIRRTGATGPVPSMLLMLGTFAIIFVFLAAALAGGPKKAPNQGLVLLAIGITVVEVLYLLAYSQGAAENMPEILALSFLPGIVIQIRNSGASKEYLLRLAAHVTAFVVWVSVILGLALPALAYSEGYSDTRRLPLAGLTLRLSGLTPHPNFLAVTAVMCIVLVLAVKMRWRRTTVVMALAAIVMAESRNAAVTLAVVAVVAWVCAGKTILGRLLLASPLVVPLVMFGMEFEGNALTADIESNGRYRVWDMVVAGFNEDPFRGFGPLAFQEESGSPLLFGGLQHAHNQVLQSVAETGIVGALLMVVLLLALVKIALRHRYEAVYPSFVTICLMGIATEPYLTMHLYGLNYAVVPAFLILVVMMSADAPAAKDNPIAVAEKVRKEKPRKDLPHHLANPNAETRRLLGLNQ